MASTSCPEGAEILFLDSPADEGEVRRAVAAAQGRPSFAVLSPGAPRETPSQARAKELGLKIGTYPTALISPVAAAIQAGLAALAADRPEADMALKPSELRTVLGYADYEAAARPFVLGN
jgi:2-methylisocitrate lyase-like PEP mutase family enzyme